MLKVEYVATGNWKAALRGMRNPMDSWDKSDTYFPDEVPEAIGPRDWKLMTTLVKSGSDDRKFMRDINLSMDIVAPEYWWSQFDSYKVGVVRNSCSKMHMLMSKPFTMDMFSTDHITVGQSLDNFTATLKLLNDARDAWMNSTDPMTRYEAWWQVMINLPQSYNQRSTVSLNYEVARNMYQARKAHRLDEWLTFCKVLESLPFSELITMEADK